MRSSKYSLYGLPEFDTRVDSDLARIVDAVRCDPESSRVKAIVLLGGYGRGEGTPLRVNGMQGPYNDYDLVVVADAPSRAFARRLHLLETQLSDQLGIAVDLYPHTPSTLRRAEPSLLNYEMQKGHQVVWGSSNALGTMPDISVDDVPLSEGTRLLMNRGKLLLDIQGRLLRPDPLSEEETLRFRKFLWKNHLAFGDCVLLAYKKYDVLYQVKEQRIRSFVDSKEIPEASWMIPAYVRAIEFKQRGELTLLPGPDMVEEWRRTRDYWLWFFLWFEGMRLGVKLESSEEYCQRLPQKETKAWTSILRNIRLLGSRMFAPSAEWIWIHPRTRLYPSLHLLLGEAIGDELLEQLLGAEGGRDRLVERFYLLRSRLS